MNETIGSIEYDARINTSKLGGDVKKFESTAAGLAESSERSAGQTSEAWASVARVGFAAAITAGTVLAATLTKAATASFNQVDAVEQATVGLKAYEKNGDAVNAVLSDLIKYARSDMGVLFNRKDLFQSAQMLKLNGVETNDLSKNVQILSRSVGLGLGNWIDLNAVVGRVISSGRLTGIEFDMLTQYGFKLDKSLRNTNITTKDFFKTLDKGIPVDAMAGQATTIRGLGIRIESAFRGIGDAILGVDADTSKFIEGGLGSMIVGFMDKLPAAIKSVSPTLRSFTTSLIAFTLDTSEKVTTALTSVFSKVGAVTSSIFNDIKAGNFEGAGETIGKGLRKGIDLSLEGIKIGVGAIKDFFSSINFVEVGKFIVTKIIPGIAIGLIAGLGELDILEDILKPIGDNIGPILLGILSIALAPAKLLAPLTKILAKIPIVGTFVNWIVKTLRGGVAPIRDAVASLFKGAGGGIMQAFAKVGNVFGAVKDIILAPFRVMVDSIALAIRLIPTTIVNSFTAALNVIRVILLAFKNVFADTFMGIITLVRTIMQPIVAFFRGLFTGIWNQLSSIFTPTGEFFSQLVVTIMNAVSSLPLRFLELFLRVRGSITGALDNIGGWFASIFNGVYNHITGIFTRLIGFFQGLWNNIVGMFGSVGTSIGNAIGNSFKNVINSVIRGAVDLINGFINSINRAVDTINKVPGVKIDKLGTLPIPQMATGGIVTSPTLAMIGEGRESEAVIPLSKLDAMINSSGPRDSGNNVNIELNMSGIMTRSRSDTRAVAADLIESINEQMRARQLPEIGQGYLRKGTI